VDKNNWGFKGVRHAFNRQAVLCLWLLQILDLSSGELKWLANHLGHDVNIHENVYRMHDSVIELSKVSRLLMAVDAGKTCEFAGKQLKDISLAGKHQCVIINRHHYYFYIFKSVKLITLNIARNEL
jgi:hypothetical protein